VPNLGTAQGKLFFTEEVVKKYSGIKTDSFSYIRSVGLISASFWGNVGMFDFFLFD
jgi:hypothetical protein